MDKKYIEGQPSAETPSKFETKPSLLHTVAEKILTAFGLMLLLPFFWWLVTARKAQKFFSWIGLMHGVMFFAAVGVLRAILITHK